jgi:hypothetical protein
MVTKQQQNLRTCSRIHNQTCRLNKSLGDLKACSVNDFRTFPHAGFTCIDVKSRCPGPACQSSDLVIIGRCPGTKILTFSLGRMLNTPSR